MIDLDQFEKWCLDKFEEGYKDKVKPPPMFYIPLSIMEDIFVRIREDISQEEIETLSCDVLRSYVEETHNKAEYSLQKPKEIAKNWINQCLTEWEENPNALQTLTS